jgi:ferric-dicitrate binding protein FerR (iron transport regulator)
MGDCTTREAADHQPATETQTKISNPLFLSMCAALVTIAIALPVWAQQTRVYRDGNSWVEEFTGGMPVAHELHINTDLGSVTVQGNAPRISYLVRKRSYAPTEKEARKQFQQMRVSAVKMGESDTIEARIGRHNLSRFGAEFIVQVPRDLTLVKVDTRSGSLAFSSIAAAIVATTGAGLIKLDDLSGPVKISSGGGNVQAGNLGSDFSVTSGASDVHVANVGGQAQVSLAGGRVYIGSSRTSTIQTGAGSIQIQKCSGDLRVVSGGGNLYIGDVDGAVQAETEGGSVRLASATGPVRVTTGGGSVELYKLSRGAQVETGAGPITVEFLGNRGFTDSFLHTAAGDVTVCLAGNFPVTVHATSDMAIGPGISSAFPQLNVTRVDSQFSPRSASAEGSLDGGGPSLRIRTTMGQIAFRRCH